MSVARAQRDLGQRRAPTPPVCRPGQVCTQEGMMFCERARDLEAKRSMDQDNNARREKHQMQESLPFWTPAESEGEVFLLVPVSQRERLLRALPLNSINGQERNTPLRSGQQQLPNKKRLASG